MLEGVDNRFPADDPVQHSEVEAENVEATASTEEENPQEVADQETREEEATETPEQEVPSETGDTTAEQEDEEEPAEEAAEAPVAEASSPEGIPPAIRPGLAEHEGEAVTMEALLQEEEYDYRQPTRGDILNGMVMSIGSDGMIIDVGLKREGIVPPNDLDRLDKETLDEISVGDEIPVYVLRPRDRDGNLLLSIHRARAEVDWTRAQELMESGEIWEGEVTAYNQGGLVVPYGKIRGFLPASQVVGIPRRLSEEAKMARLEEMVSQTLPLKVIEVDRRRRRLIFSHRAAWWKWKERQRGQLLDELQEGDTRKGVVSSLRDFGAFVDLGGADGLIHVSELAWHRVKHPSEVLKVGDEVEVFILNVDQERKRIGLSLKRLKPEPWSTVEEKYHVDQLVQGIVTRVVDFGAFVKLEEGIEGLVHKSELADIPPQRPSDLVKEGDLLLLRVIRIDVRRRRIGLSLRQVTEEEWSDWAASFRQAQEEEAAAAAAAAQEAEAEAVPTAEGEAAAVEALEEAPEGEAEVATAETLEEIPEGEAEVATAEAPEAIQAEEASEAEVEPAAAQAAEAEGEEAPEAAAEVEAPEPPEAATAEAPEGETEVTAAEVPEAEAAETEEEDEDDKASDSGVEAAALTETPQVETTENTSEESEGEPAEEPELVEESIGED